MWRKLRIAILLFVLATVAHRTWLQGYDLEWHHSLYVAVYPINFDHSIQSTSYVAALGQAQLQPIAEYLAEEAKRYGLKVKRPFEIRLGTVVRQDPPQPPKSASKLQIILWSLQFRWWAWRNSPSMLVSPDIRLYLLYHDPNHHKVLPHSTALNKGRIGLVNVFSAHEYEEQNAVVIAHELLHTVGATDKYDYSTGLPLHPIGFAQPQKQPLYPQDFAELMAGRLPITESKAEIPASLSRTMIGSQTAQEIGWLHANGGM